MDALAIKQNEVSALAALVSEKTQEYLRIPSVVAHEKPFLDYLAREYAGLGYSVKRVKNIMAVYGNDPTSGYFSAHVDRHGILSIGGGDYRFAAHAVKNEKYGEDTNVRLKQLEGICGHFFNEKVFAYDRLSGDILGEGTVEMCFFCTGRSNLIFQINGMAEMPEGTPVGYYPPESQNGYEISGQTDNALSVALIYALFAAGFQGTAIFTAEEEIGKSWQHLAGFLDLEGITEKNLIVLDTSPYDDRTFADIGAITLRNRDSNGMFNTDLVSRLKDLCQEKCLPITVKDEILLAQGKTESQLGRTELGWLVKVYNGRWNGATVQVPTFNYHTNAETTTVVAVENTLTLLLSHLNLA